MSQAHHDKRRPPRGRRPGDASSVTPVALPPVLRLRLLRNTTRWPLAGTVVSALVLPGQVARAMSSKRDFGQRGGVAVAAQRVAADDVHQPADGVRRRQSPAAGRGGRRRSSWLPITSGGGNRGRAGTSLDHHIIAKLHRHAVGVPVPRLDRFTATPCPGCRRCGLTTTGPPSFAGGRAQASRRRIDRSGRGTGTPADCLVSSLSWAIDSAMALGGWFAA